MGYTHYFTTPVMTKDQFNAFKTDAKKIVDHCQKILKIKLGDGYGENKPIINANKIDLNGYGPKLGLESFTINKDGTDDFCKTEKKPYDLPVVCILIALKAHCHEASIRTDGDGEDWVDALILCEKMFGYGFKSFHKDSNREISF